MTDKRRGDWIQTFTGKAYYPMDPRPEDVCPEDIAHHLALENRFTGATRWPLSVAEHSVCVMACVAVAAAKRREHTAHPKAEEMDRALTLAALLHDAAEAYLRDVVRPLKSQPEFAFYNALEARNSRAISDAFGNYRAALSPSCRDLIKRADHAALVAEKEAFMADEPQSWGIPPADPELLATAARFYADRAPLGWEAAELLFLQMLGPLLGEAK